VKGIKKFFEDFKKFITRGNVLDMAVGIIVGGAFTAIVTAMTSGILQPLINYLLRLIFPDGGLESIYWMLAPAYDTIVINEVTGETAQVLNLANSIYINWGQIISAVINFLLIAFVLFLIVRTVARVNEAHDKMVENMGLDEKREIRKIRKEQKVNRRMAKYIYDARVAEEKAKAEAEAKAAEEKAKEEARLAEEKATAHIRLLEEIVDLLKKQDKPKKKTTKKAKEKKEEKQEEAAPQESEAKEPVAEEAAPQETK